MQHYIASLNTLCYSSGCIAAKQAANPWPVPFKLLLATWEDVALPNGFSLLAQNTISSSQDVKFLNQLFIWRIQKMKGISILSGATHSVQGR